MTPEELQAQLDAFVGQEAGAPGRARDPVNQPMIRHWCDAVGDRNPVYTDPEFAAKTCHGGVVAPPTMLQAWIMPGLRPPQSATDAPASPHAKLFALLDEAGFTSVVATNCRQEYRRYLRPGDLLTVSTRIESVSPEKRTALGPGHFVSQRMSYRDQHGEEVAVMEFRMLKFRPPERAAEQAPAPPARRPHPGITHDTRFFWEGIEAGRLLVQRCTGCRKLRHPPGPMCPACRSLEWDAIEASGRGTIYSFAVVHHPPVPPFETPNPIALVELEEGTRIVANVVGIEPGDLAVGLPVRCEIVEVEPGYKLPRFRPVGA